MRRGESPYLLNKTVKERNIQRKVTWASIVIFVVGDRPFIVIEVPLYEKKGFRILEGIKYVRMVATRGGSCCGCGSYGAPPPSRGKRGGKTLRLERLSACALVR
jgi:hypothetical protein